MSKRFGKARVPGCKCEHNFTCGPCLQAAGPTLDKSPGERWERNVHTGRDVLRTDHTGRILRENFDPPLYAAEEWGDFSLTFPTRGRWRNSLEEARKDLVGLKAEAKGLIEARTKGD